MILFIISIKLNTEEGEGGITENGVITLSKIAKKAVSGTKWLKIKINIPIIVTGMAHDLDNLNEILNNSNIKYFGMARLLIMSLI